LKEGIAYLITLFLPTFEAALSGEVLDDAYRFLGARKISTNEVRKAAGISDPGVEIAADLMSGLEPHPPAVLVVAPLVHGLPDR
jgi:hypothetical protein